MSNMIKSEKMQLLHELVLEYIDFGPTKYTATQVCDELLKISGVKFDPNKVGQVLQFHGFSKSGKIKVPNYKSKHQEYFNHVYTLSIGKKNEHNPKDYVIQFGKYSGYRLSEITDMNYLVWVRNTVSLSSNVIEKIDERILQLRKPVQPLIADVDNILPIQGDVELNSRIINN